MTARRVLRATVLALAPALAGSGPVPAAQENVLVVVVDDVGKDIVGCYGDGGDPAPTPSIDWLAATGVRFDNAWSYPICSPTRAALQTGRHSFRTGVGAVIGLEGDYGLPLSEITLPEMLDLGTGGQYAHAAFGKWHLSNAEVGGIAGPNLAGYGHFAGEMQSPDDYFAWTKVVDGVEASKVGYLTTDQARDAITWMLAAPEPWFCYLAFSAAHTPFHAPPPHLYSVPIGSGNPLRDSFKAMVESLDTELGSVFAGLGPVLDHTTIVLLGDNGTFGPAAPPGVPQGHAKGSVYEQGVCVPFLVRSPQVTEPGSVSGALVSVTDVFATVAELAGVDLAQALPPGHELDSVSFVPYLRRPGTTSIRRALYTANFRPNGFGPYVELQEAVRSRRYKLAELDGVERFFDLAVDPFETVDLLEGVLTPAQELAYLELRLALDHGAAPERYLPALLQPLGL